MARMLREDIPPAQVLTVRRVLGIGRDRIGHFGLDSVKRDNIIVVGTAEAVEGYAPDLLNRLAWAHACNPRGLGNNGQEDLPIHSNEAQGPVYRSVREGAVIFKEFLCDRSEFHHALGRCGITRAVPAAVRVERGVGAIWSEVA